MYYMSIVIFLLQGNSHRWIHGPKLGYTEWQNTADVPGNTSQTTNCVTANQLMPDTMSDWKEVSCNSKLNMSVLCESDRAQKGSNRRQDNTVECAEGQQQISGECISAEMTTKGEDMCEFDFSVFNSFHKASSLLFYISLWSRALNMDNLYSQDNGTFSVFRTSKNNYQTECVDKILPRKPVEQINVLPERYVLLCTNQPGTISHQRGSLMKCYSGEYILSTEMCDGNSDCYDNSDEIECEAPCFSLNTKGFVNCSTCIHSKQCQCSESYFQCLSGGCIPLTLFCDGNDDCRDRSDEVQCEANIYTNESIKHLGEKSFSFKGIVSKTGSYLGCGGEDDQKHVYPMKSHCIFDFDPIGNVEFCPNGDHLADCKYSECPGGYKCLEAYCIDHNRVCDTSPDCPYGDDEVINWCKSSVRCEGMFKCKDSAICIPLVQVCNGKVHCPIDGDDEQWCFLGPCPERCQCLGDVVNCASADLDIKTLAHSGTNVKSLVLRGNKFPHHILKYYKQLQYLDLSKNSISEIRQQNFLSASHYIIQLDLSNNIIQNLFTNVFSHLVNLAVLYLHDNDIMFFEPNVFESGMHLHSLSLHHNRLVQYFALRIHHLDTISVDKLFVDNSSICCELNKVNSCYNNSDIAQEMICPDGESKYKTNIWKVPMGCIGLVIFLLNLASLIKKVLKRKSDKKETLNVTFIVMMSCSMLHGFYLARIAFTSDRVVTLKSNYLQVGLGCKGTAYMLLVAQVLKYFTSMQYFAKIIMVIYPQYKISPKKLTKVAENVLLGGGILLINACVAVMFVDNIIIQSGYLCHAFVLVSPVKYVIVAFLSVIMIVHLICEIGIIKLIIISKTGAGRILYTSMEKVLFVKTSITVIVIFIDWVYMLSLAILSFYQSITMLYYVILVTYIFSVNPICNGLMNIII